MPPSPYPWEQPLGRHPAGDGPGDLPRLGARRRARRRAPGRRASTRWPTRASACAPPPSPARPRRRLRARAATAARWPDPASRWQPDGPARARRGSSTPARSRGPTRAGTGVALARRWSSTSCTSARSRRRGRSTRAIEHLPALAELGVTAIELMPVAEFPGRRGWGYDGVYLSAAQSAYGGPEGLQRLVDAAHGRGPRRAARRRLQPRRRLAATQALRGVRPVLHRQATRRSGARPSTTTTRASSPVREWVLQSAEGWMRDFHVDGLRLDAIHAIYDRVGRARSSAEVARRVHAADRRALVIAESGLNDPQASCARRERGGLGCDAAWADDFHHALRDAAHRRARRLLRGVRHGRRPRARPTRARTSTTGDYSAFRGRRFGAPGRRRAARALRRLRPEPRPGRQPRARRPPAARPRAPLARVRDAAVALHPDAVHGRGVRRARAVSVLHRPHRRGDRHADARGAPARVRRVRRVRRRGGPRPAGAGDVRALEAHPARRPRARASSTRDLLRAAPRAAARRGRRRPAPTRRRAGCASTAAPYELCMNFADAAARRCRPPGSAVVLSTHGARRAARDGARRPAAAARARCCAPGTGR